VRRALEWPVREIAENAGVDGAVVIGHLRESNDTNVGYDAQAGAYLDMFDAGVIDPTKVMRLALEDAASIAGLLVTTEVAVVEQPEKAPTGPGAMGGLAA